MDNFFGYGSNSSAYDLRRHLNCVFYTMLMLRHTYDSEFWETLSNELFARADSEDDRIWYLFNRVFTKEEKSFLMYLIRRYKISEDDSSRVLAGETLNHGIIKSPAGYYGEENWKLIIQMFYTLLCTEIRYNSCIPQLISTYFLPFSSGMRGVVLTSSTFRLLSESIDICLDRGLTNFDDLPQIEEYVISNAILPRS